MVCVTELKDGEYTGFSLAGVARQVPSEPRTTYTEKGNQEPGWFAQFKNSLSLNLFKEIPMDKEEVRAVVRKEVGSAVTDALKSAGIIREAAPATPPAAAAHQPSDLEKAVVDAIAKGAAETLGGASLQEETWV